MWRIHRAGFNDLAPGSNDLKRIPATVGPIRDPNAVCPLQIQHRQHYPRIVTEIYIGMRLSELRGLRWEDVDFRKTNISISQRTDRFRRPVRG